LTAAGLNQRRQRQRQPGERHGKHDKPAVAQRIAQFFAGDRCAFGRSVIALSLGHQFAINQVKIFNRDARQPPATAAARFSRPG
jgi:hypothetical protein